VDKISIYIVKMKLSKIVSFKGILKNVKHVGGPYLRLVRQSHICLFYKLFEWECPSLLSSCFGPTIITIAFFLLHFTRMLFISSFLFSFSCWKNCSLFLPSSILWHPFSTMKPESPSLMERRYIENGDTHFIQILFWNKNNPATMLPHFLKNLTFTEPHHFGGAGARAWVQRDAAPNLIFFNVDR
jgi:hypothetical protein